VTFQQLSSQVESSDWLLSILLPREADRDRVIETMSRLGIETRPTFYCIHQMPMYARNEHFPLAEDIAARGVSLPSYPTLTSSDLQRVVAALAQALDTARQ